MKLRRARSLGPAVFVLALAGCSLTIKTGDQTWNVQGYAFRWIRGDQLGGIAFAPEPGTTPC